MKRLSRYGKNKRYLEVFTEAQALEREPPEHRAKLRERMLANYQALAKSCIGEYEKTDNPLYLWKAVAFALASDTPLPGEARKYLLDCAGALLEGENPKAALKMTPKGRGSFYDRMEQRAAERDAVTAYRNKCDGFETQVDAAAEVGLSDERSFRRLLKKHK